MDNKLIITIGREYGSGGREVGEKLAKKLGIGYYDKELLRKTAEQTGFTEEFIEEHEEKKTNSLLYSLVMGAKITPNQLNGTYTLPDQIYLEQFKTIRKIAEEESCVFIGRCADYALRETPNVVSIFIMAPMEARVARVAERNHVSFDKATEMIYRTDKTRASYYNYYSDKKWGKANTYNLCIDTSVTGIDGAIDVICHYIECIANAKKAFHALRTDLCQ